MPVIAKKVVRTEFTELVEGQDGLTFGQHIDQQIHKAIDEREDVQEFTLMFEESEWHAMMHPRKASTGIKRKV